MYWTLELASKLEDAPWPATKDELIDYAMRSGAPLEVIENLQEMEDEGEIYESIEDIWPERRRTGYQRTRLLSYAGKTAGRKYNSRRTEGSDQRNKRILIKIIGE